MSMPIKAQVIADENSSDFSDTQEDVVVQMKSSVWRGMTEAYEMPSGFGSIIEPSPIFRGEQTLGSVIDNQLCQSGFGSMVKQDYGQDFGSMVVTESIRQDGLMSAHVIEYDEPSQEESVNIEDYEDCSRKAETAQKHYRASNRTPNSDAKYLQMSESAVDRVKVKGFN